MRTRLYTAGLALACSLSVAAADELSAPDGEMLAHTCAACHGTHGHFDNDYMPPLAGMSEERFVTSMIAFREGSRPATIMDRVARAFSDAEIEAMAAFFAAQGATPPTVGRQGDAR
jgi:sulfide dehydrogenase cytochrome subunit